MANRQKNAMIAQETLQVLQQGSYRAGGQTVSIAEPLARAVKGSVLYRAEKFLSSQILSLGSPPFASNPAGAPTAFTFGEETTLQAASRFATTVPATAAAASQTGKAKARATSEPASASTSASASASASSAGAPAPRTGPHVGVLNFASAKNPGGGFLRGSQAQEESLARSSGLYPCIAQMKEMYQDNTRSKDCAYFHHMVFSPDVPVFRTDRGDFLEEPYLASFVTAPAVNAGVVRTRVPNAEPYIRQQLLERMDRLLAVFHHHGCNVLVLGAYGCGVFGNDLATIARLFHILLTGKYSNVFAQVHFAIPDRIQPFRDYFSRP